MKGLRDEREKISRDRQEIFAVRDTHKEKLETQIAASKAAKGELKCVEITLHARHDSRRTPTHSPPTLLPLPRYTSVDEIDKKLKELHTKQSTTSMTLKDEKILLKEMESLKSQKKTVMQYSGHKEGISGTKSSMDEIGSTIAAKNAELDAVRKKIDEQKAVLDGLNAGDNERKSVFPAMYKEKDEIRAVKNEKVKEIKTLKEAFRAEDTTWRAYQLKVKKQRDEQRKAEREQRVKDMEARRKQIEDEEAKKVPYEEEMKLCDYLVGYLEKEVLRVAKVAAANAAPVVDLPKEDEFGGKSMKKYGRDDDEEDIFICAGATGGKKRSKKGPSEKKKAPKKKDESIKLSPDMFEIFGTLKLLPPSTKAGAADAIVELKAKKTYFTTLERNAIPSIAARRIEEATKMSKVAEAPRDRDARGKGGAEYAKPQRLGKDDALDGPAPKESDRPTKFVAGKAPEKAKRPKQKEYNAETMEFPGLPPSKPKPAVEAKGSADEE